MQTVVLHGRFAGRSVQLQLRLGPEKFTQRLLLGFLQAGRSYEPKVADLLARFLAPGDAFIDVGAHIGYFSLLAAQFVGPTGKVFSFEPEEANFQHLLLHIQLNQLTNVYPLKWAANDRVETLELFSDQNDGGHAIWDLTKLSNAPATRSGQLVFSAPLDDCPALAGAPVRAIKVDVEGAEVAVLRGARSLLTTARPPLVICECHRQRLAGKGDSEAALRGLLTDLGYRVFADVAEADRLVELMPGSTVASQFIFNLIFLQPEAAQRLLPTG